MFLSELIESGLFSLRGVMTVLLTIFLVAVYRMYRFLRPPRIPGIPSVPDNSIVGSTTSLSGAGNKVHEYALRNAKSYGPIFQFRLNGSRVVAVTDKNLIRIIMRDVTGKGGIFHERLSTIRRGGMKFLNTFNMLTNEEWKLRRNKFRHPFSSANLRNYETDMNGLVTKLCDNLDAAASVDGAGGQPVQIDKLFGQLAMDAICKIAFQYDLNGLDDSLTFNKLHNALRVSLQLLILPLLIPGFYFLRFVRFGVIKKYFDSSDIVENFCEDILIHLRANEDSLPKDSLGKAFLEFSQMPDIQKEHVLSEISLAFIAGHETTAHSLSWVIYSLCKYPDIQIRAQQEMDAFERSESKDGLLPDYVEAVLKESMRKYPVVHGNVRMVTQEEGYDLGSYHLEKGDWVMVNAFSVHNLESNWGPDVDEFKPERWLPSTTDDPSPLSSPAVYAGGGETPNSISFLPFSTGVRNCLGMNMALLEIRLTLARLIKRYTFQFVDKKMTDESYALEKGLTLSPKDKLPVYVALR